MVCYENILQNATENMKMSDECLEACKYVKYGLNLNEDFPMTECCISMYLNFRTQHAAATAEFTILYNSSMTWPTKAIRLNMKQSFIRNHQILYRCISI